MSIYANPFTLTCKCRVFLQLSKKSVLENSIFVNNVANRIVLTYIVEEGIASVMRVSQFNCIDLYCYNVPFCNPL